MTEFQLQLKRLLPAAGDTICDRLKKAAQFELEWIRFLKLVFIDSSTFTDEFKSWYCNLNCAAGGGTEPSTSSTSTTSTTTVGAGEQEWLGGSGQTVFCGSDIPDRYVDSEFTVPNGVTSLHVEIWGGGGAGGQTYPEQNAGGGGGGGEYRECELAVTPGETLTMRVSTGGVIYPTCTFDGIPLRYNSLSWPSQIKRGSAILVSASTGAQGGNGDSTNEGTGGAGGTGGSFGAGTSGTSSTDGVIGSDALDCVGGDGGAAGLVDGSVGTGGVGGSCSGTPTSIIHPGAAGHGGKIKVSWT